MVVDGKRRGGNKEEDMAEFRLGKNNEGERLGRTVHIKSITNCVFENNHCI